MLFKVRNTQAQKIHKGSEISKEKEVSGNLAYLQNASMQNVLLFQTDSSPSGNVINIYDACAKGLCSCEYVLGGDNT